MWKKLSIKHGIYHKKISYEALRTLEAYNWPGNVRELKNVADRWALGMPDALTAIASASNLSLSLTEQIDAAEKLIIESMLKQCAGNVAQSAQCLQTPKKTLYDKLTRHGIVAEQFRN